jgi:hypothetical protein
VNLQETALVLAKCQAFDRRTVGIADVKAWWEVLHDVDVADALDAVTRYYRDCREWIMPSDVRGIACDIERERHRVQREARQAELERAPVDVATADRKREITNWARSFLRKGDPDQLRRPEVLAWERAAERLGRGDAEPNPHYVAAKDAAWQAARTALGDVGGRP